MSKEPEWIEHDGSAVCPVPAGHDVEVRFGDSFADRDKKPESWAWGWGNSEPAGLRLITHYRDWTAWEQQQASAEVPEWISKRRDELLQGADPHTDEYRSDYAATVNRAVEQFIAAHEQPPVDPLQEVVKAAIKEVVGDFNDSVYDRITAELRARGVDLVRKAGGEG